MGGGAPTPSPGKGGRKPLDAELNLVPFIDLLSVCITFLLITAVWTQFARLNVDQALQKVQQEKKEEELKPAVKLLIAENGFHLSVANSDEPPATMEKLPGGKYDDTALGTKLEALCKKFSCASGKEQVPVTVASEDPLKYDLLIHTLDIVLYAGFKSVTVGDASAVMGEAM